MSNTKLEVEYKMLVTKEELQKLKSQYKPIEKLDQINYYYDSNPSLYQRGFSIRIREVDNKYIFTLKESLLNGKLEHEFEINSLNINDPKIKEVLDSLEIKDELHQIVTLRTIRHIYKDECGELCMVANEYNKIVDYEVEYELYNSDENHLEHFINLLIKCDIDYVENPISKLKRLKNTI